MTFVCTPDDPTETMIDAGLRVTMGYLSLPGSQLTQNRTKMRLRYQAMLAARPTRQINDDLLVRLVQLDNSAGGNTIFAECATVIDRLRHIMTAASAYQQARQTDDPRTIDKAWEALVMLLPTEEVPHGSRYRG